MSHFVLYFSNTQLRNSIYDLEFSTLEELRRQLNKLKSCAGAKECTVRYKMPNNNIDGMYILYTKVIRLNSHIRYLYFVYKSYST